jgi:hypothetical protein
MNRIRHERAICQSQIIMLYVYFAIYFVVFLYFIVTREDSVVHRHRCLSRWDKLDAFDCWIECSKYLQFI